ncbi:MAG: pyridoxamine 5'-phosphate oxidase family protein [Actinomycetota bacterium]|nr:pyridoxamine 5'-phosphate oxidase family protein [Actinomycetota bacterium]
MASAGTDGWPHVSVVSPAVEGELLWIATRASSGKAGNIRVNPRVALVWQPGAEIYVWGRASWVEEDGEKQRLWESGVFPFDLAGFFGTWAHPGFIFIKVEPVSALVLSQGTEGLSRRRWRRSGAEGPAGLEA